MSDPTRIEIDHALSQYPFISEADAIDRETAVYWFAADWHGGKSSNLYGVLSLSAYNPGPLENGPPADTIAADLYRHLADYFGLTVE